MMGACPSCDKSFDTLNSRKIYCSDYCRTRHYKELNAKVQTCKQCNTTFRNYKAKDFCCNQCKKNFTIAVKKANIKPRKQHVLVCRNCNKKYGAYSRSSRYCSYECKYEQKVKQKPVHNLKCKECAKFFCSTNNSKVFCSLTCSGRFENRRKETARRKRIARNGKVNWDISIERLIKRDNCVCYLCGERVDNSVDTNDDSYPSIEHVIPVCKGGTHTWDNVKIAHRGCNREKVTKIIGNYQENLK